MDNNTEKLKKSAAFTIVWIAILLIAIGGATYAWFTFSAHTNVDPIGGAIGSGGVELLISDSENGEFSNYADIIVNGSTENLKPVSTADLQRWSTAVSNSNTGISNKFKDVTDNVDEYSMYGSLFLKASGGSCDVYFNRDYLSMGTDDQLIAASRLGMVTITNEQGELRRIFSLESLCNTGNATERYTMSETGVVVSDTDGSGNAVTVQDPAEEISQYTGYIESDEAFPGEKPICRLEDGEVVRVDYRIYMEGCDPNCFNDAQDRNIDVKLGFIGTEVKE
uniref:Uncharacterized protein n=1 Tax=uncultured bacterium fosmid pJB39A3 TaxID=1478063 RepID=A0A0H3UAE8_9BACT|nr:hypothetical protein [uncultured bacterium fosmid pJB39A3]